MAESVDLATLHITVSTKDVKDGISSLDGLSSAAGKAEKSVGGLSSAANEFSSSARQIITQVMAMVSAYKALEASMAFIQRGIKFSSTMEDSRIAIASVVAAVNNISDSQGNTLVGQEKFNAALDISGSLMERIQILGLETTATTQELVSAVSGIIAPAAKAGVSLEKLPDFAINATRAMQAMQIPVQQMRTEIEAILSGNINKSQDQLATNLGITSEMVKEWQKQNTLVENITKRLETFQYSGEAVGKTWRGLVSNLEEAFDVVSALTGRGIFEGAKQSFVELQAMLINTEGSVGLGNDISNIADALTRVQNAMGEGILDLTRQFIEYIRELNQPENLAVLEAELSRVWETMQGMGSDIKNVGGHIGDVLSMSLDGWNAMPEIVREMGIVGALAFGLKGRAALAGIGVAVAGIKDFKSWVEQTVGEVEEVSAAQVARQAEYMSFYNNPTAHIEDQRAKAFVGPHPEIVGPQQFPQGQQYKATGAIGGFTSKDKAGGADKIKNALEHIQRLREEIDKLNGVSSSSSNSLAQKLREIAKTGADAKLSIGEITALQAEYQKGFQTDALRDFDKQLASIQGNTQKLREIEISSQVKEWESRFKAAGMGAEEATSRIDQLKAALEKQAQYKDLQAAVSFYDELARLSGNYEISLAKQNELIALKGEIHRQNGIPPDLVAEWELLQKLEKARDPLSGSVRGLRKFSSEAGDLAKGFENVFTTSFHSASDALTDFVMGADVDLNKLGNSFVRMFAQIAAQQAMGGIASGLGSLLGNALGEWLGGGSSSTGIGSSGWTGGGGGGWATGGWDSGMSLGVSSFHSGGLVGMGGASDCALPVSLFENAPRFHNGGGYFREDEYPAVLQYGERVLNRRDTAVFDAAMSLSRAPMPAMREPVAAAPIINVYNTAKGTEARAEAQQQPDGSFKIDVIVEEVDRRMAQRVTSGTSHTARAYDATRGTSPAPAAYRG